MSSVSQQELPNIVSLLKKNNFFSSYKQEEIEEFIKNCHLHPYNPHSVIWRSGKESKEESKLDFTILLGGCLVVWDKSYGEETIDALITAGQMIGEFEFLGYDSKSFEISALTNCRLLSSTKENIEKLCSLDKGLFYHNLSKSLVDKLRFQNNLLKIRNIHGVDKRLIHLLDNFTVNPDWKIFTNITDKHTFEEFDIDIFWTKDILLGLLSTEARTLGLKLKQLISDRDIEISIHSRSTKNTREPERIRACEASEFSDKKFPTADYYKIKILDYSHLTRNMDF